MYGRRISGAAARLKFPATKKAPGAGAHGANRCGSRLPQLCANFPKLGQMGQTLTERYDAGANSCAAAVSSSGPVYGLLHEGFERLARLVQSGENIVPAALRLAGDGVDDDLSLLTT